VTNVKLTVGRSIDASVRQALDVLSEAQRGQPVSWAKAHEVCPQALEDVMAIEPGALGKAFFPGFFGGDEAKYTRSGPVGIVTVDGPLMQRGGWFWDGYEDIQGRLSAALGDDAVRAVVLRINSPGGMCAGLFEGVAAMRRAKASSGKPIVAYADETAASAAYAIASIADHIVLPDSGRVGSVGTVITLAERTKMNEADGIRVEVIATGKAKTDGHPDVPLKDEAIARFRAVADHLNGIFVGQVAEARKMSPQQVLGLEAAMFHGATAVQAGLADEVGGFDAALAKAEQLAGKTAPRPAAQQGARSASQETDDMGNDNDQGASVKTAALVAHMGMLAAIFGLSAAANEQAVQDRARGLAEGEREILRVTGKANMAEALGTVKAWQASHVAAEGMAAELATLRTQHTAREVEALISEAEAQGKITNDAQRTHARAVGARSTAELKSMIDIMLVLGGGTTKATQVQEAEGAITLTAADIDMAKQMGISLEDMKKTKRDELARKGG
jgi:signal peptide peptidase SppA